MSQTFRNKIHREMKGMTFEEKIEYLNKKIYKARNIKYERELILMLEELKSWGK